MTDGEPPRHPGRIVPATDPLARVQKAARGQRGNADRAGEYAAFAAPAKEDTPQPRAPRDPAEPTAPGATTDAPESEAPTGGGRGGDANTAAAMPPSSQADDARDRREAETNKWTLQVAEENKSLRSQLYAARHQLATLEEVMDDPVTRKLRQRIVADMAELLPLAKKQAMAGKPGLFRLITRAVGLRTGGKK